MKGTAQQLYVADPRNGSIHNYGFAVDLSLEDQNGHELDNRLRLLSSESSLQPPKGEEVPKLAACGRAAVDRCKRCV